MMKSLIITFCIISAVAAEELFCTPSSLFQRDCNSCVCSEDGKSAACTDTMCLEEQSKKYCEPGKQFHLDDFSTCICNKDGMTAACTLGLQAYGRSRHLTNNNEFCTPGSKFSLDNCNACVCSQDGTNALCTLQMCHVDKPKQICKPRESFKNYCNTCFCDDDGASYSCSRMSCDKNIWNEDGNLKYPVAKSTTKQVCEPSKRFNDYCNSCVCSNDGLFAACTLMWCDKKVWNKDGTTKGQIRANSETKDQLCTPRSTFIPDKCNTCKCNDIGTDYVCTYKMCP